MRPSRLIVEHETGLPRLFAAWLRGVLVQAIGERGQASLALPGGSAAAALLPELARQPLDWGKLQLFWGDERAVPPDDPESNFGLTRRLLIDPVAFPPQNVHRMEADSVPLAGATTRYADTLVRVLGSPPRLDVALCGLGPDGHVCSLFPGHPLLEHKGWVACLDDSPKPPRERVTLTLETLRHARVVALVALGSAKASIVRDVLQDPKGALPAARALSEASESVVFLDPGAASLLEARAESNDR
jgi:6-phosphogluconolactonase